MRNPATDPDAILITGPTASGKSALAIEMARRHGGVVINADSMQVYDVLRVVTARPSVSDMEGVPHHLYGHVDPRRSYSTGEWLREVTTLLDALSQEGVTPVIVGGTGLYFKALTGGLSAMPDIPEGIRAGLRARLADEGPAALHRVLAGVDPATAERLGEQDGQRIVRALEVIEATGRSIGEFQAGTGPVVIDPARARKIVVLPDRAVLARRIDRRFAAMLDQGAVEEVEALLALKPDPDLPAMRAIGVSQIAAMLKGEMARADVIDRASAATRQYAKRQMTWFRNQMDESWTRLDPAAPDQSLV